MKKMLIAIVLLCRISSLAHAGETLLLKFENQEDKDRFFGYYLDGGGEEQAGLYVNSWTDDFFCLSSEDSYDIPFFLFEEKTCDNN
jgi:hypothetical protein